ncbi:redox-sensitive transcriptional activator SoxR [Aestuariibacter sp. AA17]|uniref:Redox-sensitive transcriptional activator SoxR n=1 Tax=Fluctibacter corallii TaxID=2984329 RepID=A0ABT3A3H3_9ALTE|nr:redox-sensitive transcriptional activator SoxR [Aestuariibacter sp. AA17]MCV2883233.1 redox-sensitive transcriptional activator SoxR [Aestuariibacter sp. AA17]
MTKSTKVFSVGEVAKRSGVAVSTLHFYEEKGLIHSRRNTGNQRRYQPDVLRRVSVIKAAQKMGVSLSEIEQAFATLPNKRTPDKDDWATLAKYWRVLLNQKIDYLTSLRDSLTGCIGCGCLSMKHCPIYNPDDMLAEKGTGPVLLDQAQED